MYNTEDDKLQRIWKGIDKDDYRFTKDELNLLLTSKVRQAISELVIISTISVPVCTGLLVWLIFTSLNRLDDKVYLANNILLAIIVLFALFYGSWFWSKFQSNRFDQPVTCWLDKRIKLLSKWLSGKYRNLEFYLLPLLFLLTISSIHVYYAGLDFVEVFRSEKFLNEDLWGMLIFIPIVLAGEFYILVKARKYYLKRLGFLKDLQDRLCNVR